MCLIMIIVQDMEHVSYFVFIEVQSDMTKANIGAKYDYQHQNMTSSQIPLVTFGCFCCSTQIYGYE
jgi:hypothetical protein